MTNLDTLLNDKQIDNQEFKVQMRMICDTDALHGHLRDCPDNPNTSKCYYIEKEELPWVTPAARRRHPPTPPPPPPPPHRPARCTG